MKCLLHYFVLLATVRALRVHVNSARASILGPTLEVAGSDRTSDESVAGHIWEASRLASRLLTLLRSSTSFQDNVVAWSLPQRSRNSVPHFFSGLERRVRPRLLPQNLGAALRFSPAVRCCEPVDEVSLHSPLSRRVGVSASVLAVLAAAASNRAEAAEQQLMLPGQVPRIEGVTPRIPSMGMADGIDIMDDSKLKVGDAVFPGSLLGYWQCERVVASVDGDEGQARGAWKLLGGDGEFRKPESYKTRYIPAPIDPAEAADQVFNRTTGNTVLDRGFEIYERVGGAAVEWDFSEPNTLKYQRNAGGRASAATLQVIRRTFEPPSEQGWGSNELIRVTTTTQVFGSFNVSYAVRIQRRFRRAYGESGERVVEGLELMKTFRVLSGVIADNERPTSVTKATLTLTRPDLADLQKNRPDLRVGEKAWQVRPTKVADLAQPSTATAP